MEEIPVYLFTGFMDSGKTSLISETLFENEFGKDAKTLIILCEDGDVELDEGKLATIGASLVMIDDVSQITREKFHELQIEELKGRTLTTSIGIAYAPDHGVTYIDLYKHADMALYETKRNGRNGYTLYSV